MILSERDQKDIKEFIKYIKNNYNELEELVDPFNFKLYNLYRNLDEVKNYIEGIEEKELIKHFYNYCNHMWLQFEEDYSEEFGVDFSEDSHFKNYGMTSSFISSTGIFYKYNNKIYLSIDELYAGLGDIREQAKIIEGLLNRYEILKNRYLKNKLKKRGYKFDFEEYDEIIVDLEVISGIVYEFNEEVEEIKKKLNFINECKNNVDDISNFIEFIL